MVDKDYDAILDILGDRVMSESELMAMKEVRKLVEKAKPKKPYVKHIKLTESSTSITDSWYCPTCKTNQYELKENYCYECGQRLDWCEVSK